MDNQNNRKKLYKVGGTLTIQERRLRNARINRTQRDEKRQNDMLRLRGLQCEREQAPTPMAKKLEAWKKQKQNIAHQKKKPFVVTGKVKYDDKHLYQMFPECSGNLQQRTQFKAPVGVKPLQMQIETFRVLRSGVKYMTNSNQPNTKDIAKGILRNNFKATLPKPNAINNFKAVFPKPSAIQDINSTSRRNRMKVNFNVPVVGEDRAVEGGLSSTCSEATLAGEFRVKNNEDSTNGTACTNNPTAGEDEDRAVEGGLPSTCSETSLAGEFRVKNNEDGTASENNPSADEFDIAEVSASSPVIVSHKENEVQLTNRESYTLEDKNGDYFRALLEKEVIGLQELCTKWSAILTSTLPESVADDIHCTTGLAKLLIDEKLSQFRGLIDQYEHPDNNGKFRATDLQGFWDMVYKQVEDLQKKFNKLDSLKENDWVEPALVAAPLRLKGTKPKKIEGKGKSNMRAFIMAARNKLKDEENMPSPRRSIPPMSPAVMRVSHLVKNIVSSSPQTPKKERSPLKSLNTTSTSAPALAPSTESTSRPRSVKRLITTPSSGLRRSTRLSKLSNTPF